MCFLQIRTCHYRAWATTCTSCSHFSSGHICSLLFMLTSALLIEAFHQLKYSLVQAVLRALYAYFADRPLEEIPHIEVIGKTVISFCYLCFQERDWKERACQHVPFNLLIAKESRGRKTEKKSSYVSLIVLRIQYKRKKIISPWWGYMNG